MFLLDNKLIYNLLLVVTRIAKVGARRNNNQDNERVAMGQTITETGEKNLVSRKPSDANFHAWYFRDNRSIKKRVLCKSPGSLGRLGICDEVA